MSTPLAVGATRRAALQAWAGHAWPWGLAWFGLLAISAIQQGTNASLRANGMTDVPFSAIEAVEILAVDAAVGLVAGTVSGLLVGIWPRLLVAFSAMVLPAMAVVFASFGGFCMDPGEMCVQSLETERVTVIGLTLTIAIALLLDTVMVRFRRARARAV